MQKQLDEQLVRYALAISERDAALAALGVMLQEKRDRDAEEDDSDGEKTDTPSQHVRLVVTFHDVTAEEARKVLPFIADFADEFQSNFDLTTIAAKEARMTKVTLDTTIFVSDELQKAGVLDVLDLETLEEKQWKEA